MTGIILTVSKLLLVTDICLYYDQNKKELKYTLARILALTVGLLVFDVTDVMPIALLLIVGACFKKNNRRDIFVILSASIFFFTILSLMDRFKFSLFFLSSIQVSENINFEIELLQFMSLLIILASMKVTNIQQDMMKIKRIELYILLVYMTSLVILVPSYHFGVDTSTMSMQEIFILGMKSTFFVLLCWSCFKRLVERRIQWREYAHMNKELLERQEIYYETLLLREKYAQKLRHDLRNNIIAINYLIHVEEYARVKAYMSEGEQQLFDQHAAITNIPLLNIILKDLFDKYNFPLNLLHFEGKFPVAFKFTDIDNVILFSNLFKEALEIMPSSITERYINFYVEEITQGLLIKINSPLDSSHHSKNSRGVNASSGFRQKNCQAIVEKYGGKMIYEMKADIFSVCLLLPHK